MYLFNRSIYVYLFGRYSFQKVYNMTTLIPVVTRKACTHDQNLDQQGFPVVHRRGKPIRRGVQPLFSVSGDFLSVPKEISSTAAYKARQVELTRQQLNALFKH